MCSARPVSRRRWGAALLAATCLSPAGVAAQIWNGTTSSDFQVSSNWSPAVVPSGAGATAIFVNSKGFTNVTNASGTIGGLLFNDINTPSYTIELGFQGLTLATTGIVNNSSVLQTITGGGTSGILQINAGTLFNVNLAMTSSNVIFAGTASAGNASITNISNVNMNNSSTLANATVTKNGGALNFLNTSSGGQASVTLNGNGRLQFSNYTLPGTTIGSLSGAGTVNLTDISNAQTKSLTIGGNNQSTTFSGQIVGGGSIVKAGSGTLVLTGDNTYSGGTTINTGTLQIGNGGTTGSVAGNIVNNAALAFNRSDDVTYGGVISGTGSLTQAGPGQLTLTGNNTFTGGTTVNAGRLAVNGSLASGVAVLGGGNLGGTGTIGGNVTVGGAISPGNSIGTINITGNYTQNAGSTYQVEVGGQSDLINVAGTATINGGTVAVQGVAGARQTTYTIVTATGGVTGTYSGLTSNFAFVTPSLSYNAQNVFLTLQTSFAGGGGTGNQIEVGGALDKIKDAASGDLGSVITALANLDRRSGPSVLDVISGQPYADFGTMNVNNGALFMNALAQQMATARGGGGTGQRQALAQACDVAACDALGPWSAWGSALGGLGSVLGNSNTSTLSYNFGGAAVGVDYRLDPRFLLGMGVGYTHGTQWVNGFPGQAWTDSVSVAAYGSFTPMGPWAGFYVDALAGYAYYNNQLERQMSIPGLQPRTATGSTGANQFLGQVETGYRLGIYAPALATLTPFGRLQGSSVTQNAFTEAGAQSLNLNVAQQTTSSLRTVLGADLAGAIGLGNERKLDLALRLGWMHEFADTGRPITAAFSGGPSAAFTVYAATPQRDSALLGLMASTAVADGIQVYLRYDGTVGGGTDNHMLNVGARFSW